MTVTKKNVGLVLATLSAALVACSGGGGGGSSNGGGGGGGGSTSTGATSFSATDAASDEFESFQVNVTSLTLTRPNGVVLNTLPATQTVDFADLVNESQLLTAYGALAGTYTNMAITMDFSTASVILTGQTTPATIIDQNGNTVNGPLTMPIQFPNNAPLVVTPGLHRCVQLDFDLDGSCAIDTATNTVTLGPVIKADASGSNLKPHDVYGTLAAINTSSTSLTVTLNGPAALVTGPAFTINTNASTIFYVNGVPSVGAAGFALATGQPLKSAVLAQGTIDPATASITATNVEMWIQKDIVHGHVLGRDALGNLTVRGLAVDFANGGTSLSATVLLNQTITVNATTCPVYERFSATALNQNAIGVGQRVFCRGTFDQSTMSMDCTQGHVMLPETGIFGFATSTSGGTLALNVARIGRRPIADFNFTVGTTVTANPASYQIGLSGFPGLAGSLSVATVNVGDAIAVRGLIAPWNQSPPGNSGVVNATAVTIADRQAASLLYANWLPALATDLTATTSGLTVDPTGGIHHFVDPGFVIPIRFTTNQTIVPAASPGYFAIGQGGSLTLYSDFADFEAALAGLLAGGAEARIVEAIGSYSGSTDTMTATSIAVFLN